MRRHLSFVFAVLAGLAFLGIRPAFAADGELVKTAADSAVYYRGADGKRYVFPNDKIYFSWYQDFSGVREIDAAAMAALPIGGNVAYRPGTRLVKIQTDPKVYAVEPQGMLRPLASESAAAALYGTAWAKRVDDMSDAFFAGYHVGAPLDGSVFPSGCVIRRASDGAVFYVDGGSLRRIASTSVQDALRIREAFILAVSSDLSAYTLGPNLSVAEPALSDAAQLGEAGTVATDRAAFGVRADGLGTAKDFVMGAKGATVFRFSLLATSVSENHVRSMAFRSVIDEREGGSLGFSTGSDNDDGTAVYVRDRVPQVSLYDGSGNFIAGPATVDAGGQVAFTGLDLVLPAGSTRAYALRADLAVGAGFGAAPDAIAFDIADVAHDVVVVDAAGRSVPEEGTYPNGGLSPVNVFTVTDQGRAAFTWKGENGVAVTGHRVLLGALKVDALHDAYDLRAMTLRFTGQLESIDRVELESGGQTVSMPYPGNVADFENLPFAIARDATSVVTAYVVMKPSDPDFYGERIQAEMSDTQRILFVSKSNDTSFDQLALQEDPRFPLVSSPSDLLVRFTELSFGKASDTPSGPVARAKASPVLRFTAHADASGPARIKHLTFKLEPSDAASQGTPDALENWASLDGDARDDVDVVDLRRSDDASDTAVGEGDDALWVDIAYSIVSGGAKDATPEGRVSAVNDYGLVEYGFHDGHELFIPAGQTVTFTLGLATDQFAPGSWSLKVSLLGTSDVQWTDTAAGSYTPITGVVVPGLPMESPRLTVS